MTAVASAVCKVHIGEGLLRWNIGRVDAIAYQAIRRDIESRAENAAADNPSGNIDNVIGQTATVGETGRIAPNQSEAASTCKRRGGNPCI
jgi:hypothetical protein